MKKLVLVLLALMMVASVCCAEETKVFVSVTDGEGKLVMAYEEIAVTDADGDGMLTINDALIAAHIAKHEGGAEGYGAVSSEYGLSMAKLWGVENGGSYGYYLNNASAWSLVDAVQPGDHVKAYVITDMTAWSDTYCYFDMNAAEAQADTEMVLTLSAAGYDANWNPVTLPVAGAVITVNGEKTEWVTDENGTVNVKFAEEGVYVVSAVSDTQVLVAPVCIVTVVK